jgi:hypothetical protein
LEDHRAVKLQYFGKILDHNASLVSTLTDIKRLHLKDATMDDHIFVLAAIIEDKTNPFGGNFEGQVPRNGCSTFGEYVWPSETPKALTALLFELIPLNEKKLNMLQPLIEYYQKNHLVKGPV